MKANTNSHVILAKGNKCIHSFAGEKSMMGWTVRNGDCEREIRE